jgi:hypothetical protein
VSALNWLPSAHKHRPNPQDVVRSGVREKVWGERNGLACFRLDIPIGVSARVSVRRPISRRMLHSRVRQVDIALFNRVASTLLSEHSGLHDAWGSGCMAMALSVAVRSERIIRRLCRMTAVRRPSRVTARTLS